MRSVASEPVHLRARVLHVVAIAVIERQDRGRPRTAALEPRGQLVEGDDLEPFGPDGFQRQVEEIGRDLKEAVRCEIPENSRTDMMKRENDAAAAGDGSQPAIGSRRGEGPEPGRKQGHTRLLFKGRMDVFTSP